MTTNKLYLITPEAVVSFPAGVCTIVQVRFFLSAWRAVCSSWANFRSYHLCLACCSAVTVVPCLACSAFRGARTLLKKAKSNEINHSSPPSMLKYCCCLKWSMHVARASYFTGMPPLKLTETKKLTEHNMLKRSPLVGDQLAIYKHERGVDLVGSTENQLPLSGPRKT